MNRIISEELYNKIAGMTAHRIMIENMHKRGYYEEILEGLKNATLATTLDHGVKDFLEQIVAVEPDGKDLWIQTVKIRASQYLSDLANTQNAGQVGVSTGAEFFPAVDDLTDMIDHWKENTDMDTHDLVEGVMGYFRCKTVRTGRDEAISELIATLNAWDGAWKGKISNNLFDSLVAMIQRLPDLPDNGSPFEISDRGSQFYCTICGNHYWAHNPLDCPKCLSAKANLRTTQPQPVHGVPTPDEIKETVHKWWFTWMDDEQISPVFKVPVEKLIEDFNTLLNRQEVVTDGANGTPRVGRATSRSDADRPEGAQ